MAASTIAFPSASPAPPSVLASESSVDTRQSALSHHSWHVTALEICELVYSGSVPSWEAIERFYESNAIYENPLVTATSRKVIADIHAVAAQLAHIDVPRPLAALNALLGSGRDPRFALLRAWSETGDVSESESFDGHKKVIVEHTLHIMILPGIHSGACQPTPSPTVITERTLSVSSLTTGPTTLGLDLSLPSPLHLRLPIISRLSFNEAGKITHHRDFWDLKDCIGLIPGMTIAQWISGRLFAQSIRGLLWLGSSLLSSSSETDPVYGRKSHKYPRDEEAGLSSAAAFAKAVKESSAHGPLPPTVVGQ